VHRRTAVNLALAAVVAALAAFAVLLPSADRPPATVSTLAPERVEVLRIAQRDADAVVIERSAAQRWRMRQPYAMEAEPAEVERLLALLVAPSLGGFRAAGNDLREYGLQPPLAVVTADGQRFAVGATEPIDARRYLLHDGQVHLVEDLWFRHLGVSAAHFAYRAPLDPGTRIEALELEGLKLEQVGGRWRATTPASADAVVRLVERWERARAIRVREYDPSLDWRPGARIRITDAAHPLEFDVARTASELLLGSAERGLQYHLPREPGERLLRLTPPE